MQGQYPQRGPQFAPPGYPQYGPQGYYPPPQKSGFPTWAIVLIVSVVVVPFLIGILAVAAIPLIASNTDEARSSEARAALGAMKDRARVVYQRNPMGGEKHSLGLGPTELNGSYFTDANYSVDSPNPLNWGARCTGVYVKSPPYDLEIRANLISGVGTFNRNR
jgi:type II secretory pathway pseudopilin PulG